MAKHPRAIPGFIASLRAMVDSTEPVDSSIGWSEDGLGIVINNEPKLVAFTLMHYYDHSNYASMVRQLNLYGFRKFLTGPRKRTWPAAPAQFRHKLFTRDRPEDMMEMRRVGKGRVPDIHYRSRRRPRPKDTGKVPDPPAPRRADPADEPRPPLPKQIQPAPPCRPLPKTDVWFGGGNLVSDLADEE